MAEGAETFSLQLSTPSPGATIGLANSSITIASNGSGNQPPIANSDSVTVGACEGNTSVNVLGNDTDPEGSALALSSVAPIFGVIIQFSPNGAVLFSSSVSGTYQTSYVVSDQAGANANGLIAVTVIDNGGCN
jgi:hypothetical protein